MPSLWAVSRPPWKSRGHYRGLPSPKRSRLHSKAPPGKPGKNGPASMPGNVRLPFHGELCIGSPSIGSFIPWSHLHGEDLGSLGPSLVGEELCLRLPTLRELFTLGPPPWRVPWVLGPLPSWGGALFKAPYTQGALYLGPASMASPLGPWASPRGGASKFVRVPPLFGGYGSDLGSPYPGAF